MSILFSLWPWGRHTAPYSHLTENNFDYAQKSWAGINLEADWWHVLEITWFGLCTDSCFKHGWVKAWDHPDCWQHGSRRTVLSNESTRKTQTNQCNIVLPLKNAWIDNESTEVKTMVHFTTYPCRHKDDWRNCRKFILYGSLASSFQLNENLGSSF